MALTRNTGQRKKKGWKKSAAYGLGGVGFGAHTAYNLAEFERIIGGKVPLRTKASLIGAGVLLGVMAGRSIQHHYRKSQVRFPNASKARALGAGYAKGYMLSPFTGPAIAWRDLRSKMGKKYHPLKTV